MFAFFSSYFERSQPPSAGGKTMDLCRVCIALAVLLGSMITSAAVPPQMPQTRNVGPVRLVIFSGDSPVTNLAVGQGNSKSVNARRILFRTPPQLTNGQDITQQAQWTSSDNNIASVNNGFIFGASVGSATVFVSSGPAHASITVTVTAPPALVSIEVYPQNPSIALNGTQLFRATGIYADKSTKDLTQTATWTSSDTGVASISNIGLASGVGYGVTTISATSGAITGSTGLSVGLQSIAVLPANVNIDLNGTQQYTATGTFGDSSTHDVSTAVDWAVFRNGVATISSSGMASGVAVGGTLIQARNGQFGAIQGSTGLMVGLVSLELNPNAMSLAVSESTSLTVIGDFVDGSRAPVPAFVSWVSSNPGVATVSSKGVVTGVAAGVTRVTASFGTGFNVSAPVFVGLTSVAISPGNPTIPLGTMQQFTVNGSFNDSVTRELSAYVLGWSSSAPGVATINSAGLATSHGQGQTQITASLGITNGFTFLDVSAPVLVSVARFAYVANSSGNTVSIYAVNAQGQLRHNGYIFTGNGTRPASVVVDPSSRFAYVIRSGTNDVQAYSINATNGALTPVGSPIITGTNPAVALVGPSGHYLYVANSTSNDVSGYSIDGTSGALTSLGAATPIPASGKPTTMTADPLGKFLYVNSVANGGIGGSISGYTVNANTGALTSTGAPFGGIDGQCGGEDFKIEGTGRFGYITERNTQSLCYAFIDPTTGVLTSNNQGGRQLPGGAAGPIAIDPTNQFLYVVSLSGTSSILEFKINSSDGTLSSIAGSPAVGSFTISLTIDDGRRFLYAANSGSEDVYQYAIAPGTGVLTSNGIIRTRQSPQSFALATGPTALAATPKFVYTANFGDNTVSGYTVNANSGALTSTGAATTSGNSPYELAADAYGRFLYVANYNANSLTKFVINNDGTLGNPAGITTGITTPTGVAVEPSGRFLYVLNYNNGGTGSVTTYSINQNNGSLTGFGNPINAGTASQDISVDPTGQFLYVVNISSNNVSSFSIDPGTGALTSLGAAVAAGTGPQQLAVHPSGQFAYVANSEKFFAQGDVSQYNLSASTGTISSLGANANAGTSSTGIAADPSGRFAYVTNLYSGGINGGDVTSFSINASTGALTNANSFAAGTNPYKVTVDPSGKFAYVITQGGGANGILVFTIDPNNGNLASAGSASVGSNPRGIITVGALQ